MPCPTNICDPSKLMTDLSKKKNSFMEYDESPEKLTWCSGCGNFSIHNALKRAVTLENIKHENLVLCFDVGCNGNASDKMSAYTIHGLHGRVISLATGCALGNPNLTVIAAAGDGGTFSEGIGHLVHAVRNNYNIVFLHHNNNNYGLTTGQASATTPKGYPMNSSPDGVTTDPINPVEFVLTLGGTFVARTFSGDTKHVTEMIRQGLRHKGFAFIEILQVCTTYNKATPQNWYWDRIKYIEDLKKYDEKDLWGVRKAAEDIEKDILVGVLYRNPQPPYQERLMSRKGVKTTPVEEVKHYNVNKLLKEFE